MGMGEFFLNIDNLFKVFSIILNENGINILKRKIIILIFGVVLGIEKILLDKILIEFVIFLYSVINEKRDKIILINKNFFLEDLLVVLIEY